MNKRLSSYFISNKLKYKSLVGIIYNVLFSIKGRAIIYIYYSSEYNNILSFILRRILKSKYHIEIGFPIKLGYYLVFNHPYNIIIDANVEIGDNCQIDQNVTVGGSMRRKKIFEGKLVTRPVIGNNVILCSGCLVGGPIAIKDNCIIGANATVTFNVDSGCIVSNISNVMSKNIIVEDGSYRTLN
ncbi:hypothetical protein WBJ53_18920 [Spirosoma sp. SC4-14]|uniref:hypothetical protein n=1 Tax=Spirosoma sp. SC4-14 TaxID=3128900 RepID=UPI0030D46862